MYASKSAANVIIGLVLQIASVHAKSSLGTTRDNSGDGGGFGVYAAIPVVLMVLAVFGLLFLLYKRQKVWVESIEECLAAAHTPCSENDLPSPGGWRREGKGDSGLCGINKFHRYRDGHDDDHGGDMVRSERLSEFSSTSYLTFAPDGTFIGRGQYDEGQGENPQYDVVGTFESATGTMKWIEQVSAVSGPATANERFNNLRDLLTSVGSNAYRIQPEQFGHPLRGVTTFIGTISKGSDGLSEVTGTWKRSWRRGTFTMKAMSDLEGGTTLPGQVKAENGRRQGQGATAANTAEAIAPSHASSVGVAVPVQPPGVQAALSHC